MLITILFTFCFCSFYSFFVQHVVRQIGNKLTQNGFSLDEERRRYLRIADSTGAGAGVL